MINAEVDVTCSDDQVSCSAVHHLRLGLVPQGSGWVGQLPEYKFTTHNPKATGRKQK